MQATGPSSRRPHGRTWLDQVFRARAARTGGVIIRQIRDVEREVGLPRLEHEVRRRGFHLLRTETHYLIICNSGSLQVIL